MNELHYESVLGRHFAGFVALRHSLGYVYQTQQSVLRHFDRILQREMLREGPVGREIVEAWLRSLERLRPTTRRTRLSIIRQFLLYLLRFYPGTFVPDRSFLPGPCVPRPPHIYTEVELTALLNEAHRYPRRYRRQRWLLWHTLIAFLYVTGLRISEALSLKLGDVDLQRGVVHVRKTKFHKSRLVPLLASSCRGVQRYLVARAERGYATVPGAWFFPGRKGGRLAYSTARQAFRCIEGNVQLASPPGLRRPRLHDLRHSTAVSCLYRWYREGRDVQALLPALVTYLGHSAVSSTEVYLTATAELLSEAGVRFEHDFPLEAQPDGGGAS